MSLHVADFSGGVVVDGSADMQRTNEVQVADSFDIGHRGALIVTTDVSDYLLLKDNGTPSPWTALWAILECAGFNFSKVIAVGEGVASGAAHYLMTSFNREGEASPFLWGSAGSIFGYADVKFPTLPPDPRGVWVMGAEFAGIYPIRYAIPGGAPPNAAVQVRVYFINIGSREGVAPNVAPGLYMVSVVPPLTTAFADPIQRFDILGTGSSGLLTVPVALNGEGAANGGTHAQQLYFRGILSYNSHLFGWGFDANDQQIGIISGVTNAVNAVVHLVGHGWATGDTVTIRGVIGMTGINSPNPLVITKIDADHFSVPVDTTASGAYVSDGVAVKGNGDGPAKVMFFNLGNPLKCGNDNVGDPGTDRLFTDSDSIILGGAGEIIRAGTVFEKKAVFGTNRGIHFIDGYGRDSYLTDGANQVKNALEVIGPNCLKEGPDGKLYGVAAAGLWRMPSVNEGVLPEPLFEILRDYKSRSNGYWDLIWTDYTRNPATYPGLTNQDLVWLAMDTQLQQVIIGIPWCSINNGYGYGTDTVVIKYHVRSGGFTRQLFPGVQYTAQGYFKAIAQQAAEKFMGTATAGQATIKRMGYKPLSNVLGWFYDAAGGSPALPTSMPEVRFGPYLPFGADGRGVVKRLYLVVSWDTLSTPITIVGISNANPAQVTTVTPHGFVTGQKIDISGAIGMPQINGGPYTITVTGAITFTLNGVDSTGFGVFNIADPNQVSLPLSWVCTLKIDEAVVPEAASPGGGTVVQFNLSIRHVAPPTPQEGDLWLDTSQLDPSLGNLNAGNITLAKGGYLLRVRRDNTPVLITGITKASPAVVTAPAHGLTTGQRVSIRNVVGMTQVNNDIGVGPYTKDFSIVVIDGDHFSLVGIDSTGYTAYSSGGQVCLAWLLVPGLGGQGTRASMPLPVVRQVGTRYTFDMLSTILTRRWQVEGFGFNPGDGETDA